jgi:hypothetical protein
MVDREPYRDRIELLQGTLDLLVLKTLSCGPAHGHTIAKVIERGFGEYLQVAGRSTRRSTGSARGLGAGGRLENKQRQGLPLDRRRPRRLTEAIAVEPPRRCPRARRRKGASLDEA